MLGVGQVGAQKAEGTEKGNAGIQGPGAAERMRSGQMGLNGPREGWATGKCGHNVARLNMAVPNHNLSSFPFPPFSPPPSKLPASDVILSK